ncbi:MAG: hypothetical protein HY549_11550 [Elusimicrobia bacterium]|nr:hypothetical protein [Elusimicrobiota bacterium]
MSSFEPRIARDYLTPTGLPVRVTRLGDGLIVFQSLVSDNRIVAPATYPLGPMRLNNSSFAVKSDPYQSRGPKSRKEPSPPKPLAPLIDAMLRAGNKTMRGILRELRHKVSVSCRGRDLEANVRARLYWLQKRGYQIERKNGRMTATA